MMRLKILYTFLQNKQKHFSPTSNIDEIEVRVLWYNSVCGKSSFSPIFKVAEMKNVKRIQKRMSG